MKIEHVHFSPEEVPAPRQIQQALPLQKGEVVAGFRQQVVDILEGRDPRLLLVVGPCSIHNTESALEYAEQLKQLEKQVGDAFFLVMRAYMEKPRTRLGWKGFLHDPFLDGSHDLIAGLQLSRRLFLDLTEMEVPIATEFLDPATTEYYGDLVTWGCIGARTVTSQIHRQIASGLPLPVGFKNSVDGNIDVAIHALEAAAAPHTYIGMNPDGQLTMIKTKGNTETHVVLRGSVQGTNYDPLSIKATLMELEQHGLPERVMVDCSHDNSQRNPDNQIKVFRAVMNQYDHIRGCMLESHFEAGNQPLTTSPNPYQSITDPCLDWERTKELILWGADQFHETSLMQQTCS
ncbi:MAG: 3-deoxy-7-phosphoheptulonate synthase [Chlamydiia bacterium]|nr:3-deoxy-7-phosphoheptulonate synthase [Chlamydiia bacterium]